MIQQAISNLKSEITTQLQTHEAKSLTQILHFRNEQLKNRIQRKYLTIPKKKTYTWIKLFDKSDVDGATDSKNVIILNVWVKKWDRYHYATSSLLEKDFNNSIEFFYDKDMTAYYTYFSTVPDNWDMSCIFEWLRIPQPISVGDSKNVPSRPGNN